MNQYTDMTVVNVGYHSTNYWVISTSRSRLLVDLGWPGSLKKMELNLKRMNIPINEIKYSLATHYHIDHAGLAQELKDIGIPLLLLDVQVDAITSLEKWVKPHEKYLKICQDDNKIINCNESRQILGEIGIQGEIIHTPGHSSDSISLILDDGRAFIGDLTNISMIEKDKADITLYSWKLLQDHGVKEIYPGHGPVYLLKELNIVI